MTIRPTILKAFVAVAILAALGCGGDAASPELGMVSVLVTDGAAGPPVPDAAIRLVPANVTTYTDQEGRAVFRVAPGDYVVEADLCCIGPGFIEYREPVTVDIAVPAEMTLYACLSCN